MALEVHDLHNSGVTLCGLSYRSVVIQHGLFMLAVLTIYFGRLRGLSCDQQR